MESNYLLKSLREALIESVFRRVSLGQSTAIIESVVNLRFTTTLASCLRRAVERQLVRARRCSSFRICTFFPVQNTYISKFCSYCKECSSTCTAFQQVRMIKKWFSGFYKYSDLIFLFL